jgi:hypothetical protein
MTPDVANPYSEIEARIGFTFEPDSRCSRCGEPDPESRVYDAVRGASVCLACAAEWLAVVIEDFEASLSMFLGVATSGEVAAHEQRVAAAREAEKHAAARAAERALRNAERAAARKAAAEARKREKQDAADALRDQQAAKLAQHIHTHGPTTRTALAEAAGISARTLERLLPLACQRNWLVKHHGGEIGPGPFAPDPNNTKDNS